MRRFLKQTAVFTIAVLLIGFGTCPSGIHAQKQFKRALSGAYKLERAINKCSICHAGKKATLKNLNAFGQSVQMQAAMKDLLGVGKKHKYTRAELAKFLIAVKALENEDADGDGATNHEELTLGTFPGDKKSKPAKEALTKYRKEHPAPSASEKKKDAKVPGNKKSDSK